MAGLLSSLAQGWKLARTIEELLGSQKATRDSLEIVAARLRALEERMTQLEANQNMLIVQAGSAASAASTAIVSGALSETITRITRLEERGAKLQPSAEPGLIAGRIANQ